MNYIGMDIHKIFTVAVVKDEQGNLIEEQKFENSRNNFSQFLGNYPVDKTKIVMESTCVWEYIFDLVDELGYDVKLSNPTKTKAIASARIKTDSVDANTLCDLLRANLVAESYIPPKNVRRLRELTRERKTFVKQMTQMKNKLHALLIKRGIKLPYSTLCKGAREWLYEKTELKDIVLNYIDYIDRQEEELERLDYRIKEVSYRNKEAQILMTLPGIGSIRAVEIVAEIGEIKRFENSSKLCSYAGLVPSIKQSGNTLRFGTLVRQSSRALKGVFIEASWNAVRTKEMNQFGRFYRKLCKKKSKQKAICATARKMCATTYSMLNKNQEFIIL